MQRVQIKRLRMLYQEVVVLYGLHDVEDFLRELERRMGGDAR